MGGFAGALGADTATDLQDTVFATHAYAPVKRLTPEAAIASVCSSGDHDVEDARPSKLGEHARIIRQL